ncbi:hypothetical protein E8E13_005396 [Curvularia kusanoi]|uniref:Uncharacterized protein n=1 Tax=Curvularia kusanoi TaxID=90978 RepID=A0A9P4T789_CURKU|nr:hypothetical protein E8E13_005396 [Curvularia kusanoi]
MHRALLLPEIVTAIVRAGKTEPGLLYSCLFVNKLFSHEACRILWKGCYGIFGVSHVTPKISDLGNMVLRADIGLERAQVYANFIRILVFQEDEFTSEDDAQWHPQLCQLQFPLLEDLNIWKTKSAEQMNTERTILHYAHPGLRDLRVDASGPLSDHFLDELGRLSPRLQQLDIDFKNVTISKEGLARFLGRMPSLESIHVAALEKSWSTDAFVAVAKYERLKLLHIPAVPDSWFDDTRLSSVPDPFPVLKYLYCLGMTDKGLRYLHASCSGLEALHLYNSQMNVAELILPAAAQFSRLTKFRYLPGPLACITGQDLVGLARGCTSLVSLSIGQDEMPYPTSTGIDDSIWYSLAEALPSVEELILYYKSTHYPNLASILLALTQHCPLLHKLETCFGSDWTSLCPREQPYLLPNLWSMKLQPQLNPEQVLTRDDHQALICDFETHAEQWFPRLEFLIIDEAIGIPGSNWEQPFMDHISNLAYEREEAFNGYCA